MTQSQNTKADAAIRVDTLYDGLGRQTAVNQYENASQYIQTATAYDGLGRTQATTNPSRPGDGLGFPTTYTYDGLGRAKSVQTAEELYPAFGESCNVYGGCGGASGYGGGGEHGLCLFDGWSGPREPRRTDGGVCIAGCAAEIVAGQRIDREDGVQ